VAQRSFEESWYLRFHGLMPFRVRDILLVASPYDAFTMEEDGGLMTRLFHEYSELNLSELPTIIRAYNASMALELLRRRKFDLVITMVNLPDTDAATFGAEVKQEFPQLALVLFAFTDGELNKIGKESAFDALFLWTGDASAMIGAIKLIEDRRNLDNDTAAGVRVIVVVEDSVRHYSSFLSLLYFEMIRQAGSLIAEGINDLHKRMRMRARPKILLANDYESAVRAIEENRHNLLAVISDVRFPKGGRMERTAGFQLVTWVRERTVPDLPILLQSAEPEAWERASELDVAFANKGSPNLLRSIRDFLRDDLGFGDFIFRLRNRHEVGRASNLYEMEHVLPRVPDESIAFHAERNHFSAWLMARGMFMLSKELRPRKVEEFNDVDGLRQHLLGVLRLARRQEHVGAIVDFSGKQESDQQFIRLGTGSIGGKGRAIAFVNSILKPTRLQDRFDNLAIHVKQTVAIGVQEFERFVEENRLGDILRDPPADLEIRRRFLEGRLGKEFEDRLEAACTGMTKPLAVRSSSILEDSRSRPFAGIYATYMLPNNHSDPMVRRRELFAAVKAVWASTYCENARAYMAGTPHTIEEERMGIAIQEIVGRQHHERFYPDFAGVAYSYNFYPVAGQVAEEGCASIALGLGRTVVDGGRTLQFSPTRPRILPQFTAAHDFVEFGQSQFYALDLRETRNNFINGESPVRLFDLRAAEEDGTLAALGSVYCPEDDTIRDNLLRPGPRVVTFNNVLRWETIPLAEALAQLLDVMRHGFGHGVEIEFAVDLGGGDRKPTLYVLQVRPQGEAFTGAVPPIPSLPGESFLCRTDVALGHGKIDGLLDIIYVKPDFKDRGTVQQAARQVGELNDRLKHEDRTYLLIGPGRWGSSDPRLGIPVVWSQISNAKVIIETRFDGRTVEPSQGSHFFHNVLSMQVGYLTLSLPEQFIGDRLAVLDDAWLDLQPAEHDLGCVRHLRLKSPLDVYLDGRAGKAAIVKPAAQ
jgi:CheY-like chemotaxis protein